MSGGRKEDSDRWPHHDSHEEIRESAHTSLMIDRGLPLGDEEQVSSAASSPHHSPVYMRPPGRAEEGENPEFTRALLNESTRRYDRKTMAVLDKSMDVLIVCVLAFWRD